MEKNFMKFSAPEGFEIGDIVRTKQDVKVHFVPVRCAAASAMPEPLCILPESGICIVKNRRVYDSERWPEGVEADALLLLLANRCKLLIDAKDGGNLLADEIPTYLEQVEIRFRRKAKIGTIREMMTLKENITAINRIFEKVRGDVIAPTNYWTSEELFHSPTFCNMDSVSGYDIGVSLRGKPSYSYHARAIAIWES